MSYQDNEKHYREMEDDTLASIINDSVKQAEFHRLQTMKHDELWHHYIGRARLLQNILKERVDDIVGRSSKVQATAPPDASGQVSGITRGIPGTGLGGRLSGSYRV